MNNRFPSSYWSQRWQNADTGWDIGYASTPLADYFNTLENKDLRILIPGAGNAWEAEYLYLKGFNNVFVLDIAPEAISNFGQRVPQFPENQLILGDFFDHFESYDLIVEQTFFCALDPALRAHYVQHSHRLLQPGGELIGLLFDDPLNTDGPPFGGSAGEYRNLFSAYFDILKLETASNSIKPRQGRELLIHFSAK